MTPLSANDIAGKIDQHAAAVEAQMIAWRRDIHAHPELACQEVRTSGLVAAHLRALGFDEVRTGLGGGTGVVGILHGTRPGPTVALRADMDALPLREETGLPFASTAVASWGGKDVPVMHACGHDAHTAILMAAAQVFAALRDEIAGSVLLLFQPAEEGAPPGWEGLHGAARMIADGALADPVPDALFGLHVVAGTPRGTCGQITYHTGVGSYAMRQFVIVVTGRGGHASMPWRFVDPLVAAAQVLIGLQTIISRSVNVYDNDATLSVCSFHGGANFNVIPERVVMEGALRITDASARAVLERRIVEVVTGIAAAAGATGAVEWGPWYPQLRNDPALAGAAPASFIRATGDAARVVEAPPFALDDFSEFSEVVPALFFTVNVPPDSDDPGPAGGHHTPDFRVNEAGLLVGLKAMLHLSFDTMARRASRPPQTGDSTP